jgi:hypothetical protein
VLANNFHDGRREWNWKWDRCVRRTSFGANFGALSRAHEIRKSSDRSVHVELGTVIRDEDHERLLDARLGLLVKRGKRARRA